jgi:hypothetical protein
MRNYEVIAVDFDGTLCSNKWPEIGEPNTKLIEELIRYRLQGNKLILWTCRCGERLEEAIRWCKYYGLEFDSVNDNLPELVKLFGNNCRKVNADKYIDDKNCFKYSVPFEEEE